MNYVERPRSKQQIVAQPIGNEILLYDEKRHLAFCLNTTSAAVWGRCNGANTIRQIASGATLDLQVPVSEQMVLLTLEQLQHDGLLEAAIAPVQRQGMSRRQLVHRLGAGAAMMLPVVTVLMAPRPAQAYNGCVDCQVQPVGPNGADVPLGYPASRPGGANPQLFTP